MQSAHLRDKVIVMGFWDPVCLIILVRSTFFLLTHKLLETTEVNQIGVESRKGLRK